MIRLGLCCTFLAEPIRFRRVTARTIASRSRRDGRKKLAEVCRHNAEALEAALGYCHAEGIGCFRVNSQILPLRTHPEQGYRLEALPGGRGIRDAFERCGELASRWNVRTTFHPDQFVVLSSPRDDVVAASIAELEYQAEVARWIGADVINVHGGGVYGDKATALERLARVVEGLGEEVRSRLTFENDDRSYTPADLLPLCHDLGVPLVYDVHHHRCLPDGEGIEETTSKALETWSREPLFHLSSPKHGWKAADVRSHHDYVDPSDFPHCWRDLDLTVEVEAKAKEVAVKRLARDLGLAS